MEALKASFNVPSDTQDSYPDNFSCLDLQD